MKFTIEGDNELEAMLGDTLNKWSNELDDKKEGS